MFFIETTPTEVCIGTHMLFSNTDFRDVVISAMRPMFISLKENGQRLMKDDNGKSCEGVVFCRRMFGKVNLRKIQHVLAKYAPVSYE